MTSLAARYEAGEWTELHMASISGGTHDVRLPDAHADPVLVGATAGGCSSSSGGEPPCLPPAYTVSPSSAKPGETVTVTAPDADCNPRYGANARIQVIVTDEKGVMVINTTTEMTDAGGFTYTFDVPDQMAVGNAAVTAMPYNIDWCDDTGRNNRAAGETVKSKGASCAMPVESLSIRR